MHRVGLFGRRPLTREICKDLIVAFPYLPATLEPGRELGQLLKPDRCLHVSHVVLEPRLGHFVMAVSMIVEPRPSVCAQPMQSQNARSVGNLLLVRAEHAPLDSGQIFCHVKAEAARAANGPDLAALIPGFDGVGGVLYQNETVTLRNVEKGTHLTGPPGKMNGNDGAGAGRNGC